MQAIPISQKKNDYLTAIKLAIITERALDGTGWTTIQPLRADRKTVACTFRLLNVLLSDDFSHRFACVGDLATRADLDTRSVGQSSAFWVDVTTAYNDEDSGSYICINHARDDLADIDPAAFKCHDGKNLWKMLKEVGSAYRQAYAKSKRSGSYATFINSADGRADVFYLHLLTTITKPNLQAAVVQTLPEFAITDTLESAFSHVGSKQIADKSGKWCSRVFPAMY